MSNIELYIDCIKTTHINRHKNQSQKIRRQIHRQPRFTIKNLQTRRKFYMYIGRFEAKTAAGSLNLSHFDSFVDC